MLMKPANYLGTLRKLYKCIYRIFEKHSQALELVLIVASRYISTAFKAFFALALMLSNLIQDSYCSFVAASRLYLRLNQREH